MRKRFRRISVLLALAMVMTMISGGMVFAEEDSSEEVLAEAETISEEETAEETEAAEQEETAEETEAAEQEETAEETEAAESEEDVAAVELDVTESEDAVVETEAETEDETVDEAEESDEETTEAGEEDVETASDESDDEAAAETDEEEESDSEEDEGSHGSILCTGSCGSNTSYTIYEDGTMVVSGEGAVEDNIINAIYAIVNELGYDYLETIYTVTSIEIEEGVTEIADSAFQGFPDSLTKVTIAASVTSIGSYAFAYDYALSTVVIEGSPTIEAYAFFECSLSYVEIQGGVLKENSFANSGLSSEDDLIVTGDIEVEDGAFANYVVEIVSFEDGVLVITYSGFEDPEVVIMIYPEDYSSVYWLAEGEDYTLTDDGEGTITVTLSEEYLASLENGLYYLYCTVYINGETPHGETVSFEINNSADTSDDTDEEAEEVTAADADGSEDTTEAEEDSTEEESNEDDVTETADSVETGDDSTLVLWGLMMLLSGCACVGMAAVRFKRR